MLGYKNANSTTLLAESIVIVRGFRSVLEQQTICEDKRLAVIWLTTMLYRLLSALLQGQGQRVKVMLSQEVVSVWTLFSLVIVKHACQL